MFRMRAIASSMAARERGVYADECLVENLQTEGFCEVPHDIGAVEVLVSEHVAENLDNGVFEIGFGEGHKLDRIFMIYLLGLLQKY